MLQADIGRAELREFTDGVLAGTSRSLEFLRAIESTLTWLGRLTAQLKVDADFAEVLTGTLPNLTGIIDPDGLIAKTMEEAQNGVDELYQLLIVKRQHGRNDHQLTDDDGIEDAYTEAIAQAADLHNNLNTLRWAISEHDIDC